MPPTTKNMPRHLLVRNSRVSPLGCLSIPFRIQLTHSHVVVVVVVVVGSSSSLFSLVSRPHLHPFVLSIQNRRPRFSAIVHDPTPKPVVRRSTGTIHLVGTGRVLRSSSVGDGGAEEEGRGVGGSRPARGAVVPYGAVGFRYGLEDHVQFVVVVIVGGRGGRRGSCGRAGGRAGCRIFLFLFLLRHRRHRRRRNRLLRRLLVHHLRRLLLQPVHLVRHAVFLLPFPLLTIQSLILLLPIRQGRGASSSRCFESLGGRGGNGQDEEDGEEEEGDASEGLASFLFEGGGRRGVEFVEVGVRVGGHAEVAGELLNGGTIVAVAVVVVVVVVIIIVVIVAVIAVLSLGPRARCHSLFQTQEAIVIVTATATATAKDVSNAKGPIVQHAAHQPRPIGGPVSHVLDVRPAGFQIAEEVDV
mmetsp:Transcript_12941/g.24502  ORF Transcript_12941/g.24502 Transcript_12941/m.24502 type:complete len:414 (-) Transcript_12941:934-2175(-)